MKTKFHDVSVAKDYETTFNGTTEKKTVWNRVGTAWRTKNGESLLLELYLFPGQKYLINMKEKDKPGDFETFEDVPF